MEAMTVPPFERFYAENRDAVFAHLVRLLGRQRAEDAFQETFLRALRGYDSLRHGRYLRAWVFTIATRVAADEGRKRRPEPAADLDGETTRRSAHVRADRASRGRAPGEGARRSRAPLWLRPVLLGHRHRTRLQRGGGPPGRFLGSAAPAKEAAMTARTEGTRPPFQGSRDRGGARRRLVRRRRHPDRPAPPRRHRARPLPDLVRSRAGPRDRDARPDVRRAGPARPARARLRAARARRVLRGPPPRLRPAARPPRPRGLLARHPRAPREGALRRGHDLQVAWPSRPATPAPPARSGRS